MRDINNILESLKRNKSDNENNESKIDEASRDLDNLISEVYGKANEYKGSIHKLIRELSKGNDNKNIIRELEDIKEEVLRIDDRFATKVVDKLKD